MLRSKSFALFAPLALVLAAGLAHATDAGVEIGTAAPAFKLTDTNGKTHQLSDFKGKYVVLEWLNYDCPFVKKHYGADNMQGTQKKAEEKKAVWLSIVSSAKGKQGNYSPAELNKMSAERRASPTAILIDENGTVGHLYDAKTTPHMFVIDPKGTLIYKGAIDDKPSTDKEDIAGSKNYVLAALNESMSGKKVTDSSTKPYGCGVKY